MLITILGDASGTGALEFNVVLVGESDGVLAASVVAAGVDGPMTATLGSDAEACAERSDFRDGAADGRMDSTTTDLAASGVGVTGADLATLAVSVCGAGVVDAFTAVVSSAGGVSVSASDDSVAGFSDGSVAACDDCESVDDADVFETPCPAPDPEGLGAADDELSAGLENELPVVSADATAATPVTAAPIPSATANPPTRPMYVAAFTTVPTPHWFACYLWGVAVTGSFVNIALPNLDRRHGSTRWR